MGKLAGERRLADNEAKAVGRRMRISPQKLNLVAQTIRGKSAEAALAELAFSRRRIAGEVRKMPAVRDCQRREQSSARRRPPRCVRGQRRPQLCHAPFQGTGPRPYRAYPQAVQPFDAGRARARGDGLMGQKCNPIGCAWASTGPGIRAGMPKATTPTSCTRTWRCAAISTERLSGAGLSRVVVERPAKKGAGDHPHGAAGGCHRQEGCRYREAAPGTRQDDRRRGAPEHRRDPQAGDRRQAGGREHRPAADPAGRVPPRHEARGAVGHAARRPRHPHSIAAAGWAARKSPGPSGIAKAACRCTPCAPTSTTASPRRRRPTAPAGSRSGSSRAKSWPTTRWPRTNDCSSSRPAR